MNPKNRLSLSANRKVHKAATDARALSRLSSRRKNSCSSCLVVTRMEKKEGKKYKLKIQRAQLAKVLLQSITRKMDRITTCSIAILSPSLQQKERNGPVVRLDFPLRLGAFPTESIHQFSLIRCPRGTRYASRHRLL